MPRTLYLAGSAILFFGALARAGEAAPKPLEPGPLGPHGSVSAIPLPKLENARVPALFGRPSGGDGVYQKVALSPDGKELIVSAVDGVLRLFATNTGKRLGDLKGHEGKVNGLAYARDGRLASAGNDGTVRVWDLLEMREKLKFEAHDGGARAVAFSPDGLWLASSGEDAKIKLWDLREKKLLRVFEGHGGGIDALAFGADGRTILSEASDVSARLWDAVLGRESLFLPERDGSVASLDLSPDARLGVTTRGDATWHVFDTGSGEDVLVLGGQAGNGSCVRFAPDGRTLATGALDGTLRLWDLETGIERRRLASLPGPLKSLALDASGRWLVSLDTQGQCLKWDLWGPPPREAGADPERAKPAEAVLDAWNMLELGEHERLAVWVFLDFAEEGLALLRQKLQPASEAPGADLEQLVAHLDADAFMARETAEKQLRARILEAWPLLVRAAKGAAAPEVRIRAARLLAQPAEDQLRARYFAVEALDWMNTPQAAQHLEALAAGAPEHPVTSWARIVLARKKARR
ncbi:MAG: hypothetical protein M5U26_25720 [Planctomycetota bacterium]|nr:hypothetical protein [Planctomycetota bacterium]